MIKKTFIYLFFLILCLLPTLSYSLTLDDLKDEVRRNMRDTDSTRKRYSDTILLSYINEAQREVVNATWLLDKVTSYVLTANTTYYELPSDLIAIHQVYFKDKSNQTTELDEVSQESLYDKDADWERNTGTPDEYWVSNATSPTTTSASNLRISYIPIPTNTSTGTVTIWYYNQVTDLSSDSDIPFEGRRVFYPYHLGITYHTTARLKLLERKVDEATAYFQLFNAYILNLKDRLGRKPNYHPGMTIQSK